MPQPDPHGGVRGPLVQQPATWLSELQALIGMHFCPACGCALSSGGRFCAACGTALHPPVNAQVTHPATRDDVDTPMPGHDVGEQTLRRIADYERISGILWLILGIVQVLMIVTIIVGIWNIYAATTRMKLQPLILARDSRVPAAYEGVGQLIVIGVLNLLLGGIIGVVFVVFDFIIRDMVLSNRHLFNNATNGVQA